MKKKFHIFILILFLILLAACTPKTDSIKQVNQAVAATIAAIPTYTPYPAPTAFPTPTPMTLTGLFCEYQFCVAHTPDIAFFDVSAQRNPSAPSSYAQGLLAGFNSNLFVEMLWQHAPGTSDPKFMLDLILEDGLDERFGEMDVLLIRNMNVMYTAITTTATEMLPFGGAAAWTCGDRVFAWKTYTPQEDLASALFQEAINRFRCE